MNPTNDDQDTQQAAQVPQPTSSFNKEGMAHGAPEVTRAPEIGEFPPAVEVSAEVAPFVKATPEVKINERALNPTPPPVVQIDDPIVKAEEAIKNSDIIAKKGKPTEGGTWIAALTGFVSRRIIQRLRLGSQAV